MAYAYLDSATTTARVDSVWVKRELDFAKKKSIFCPRKGWTASTNNRSNDISADERHQIKNQLQIELTAPFHLLTLPALQQLPLGA